MIVSGVEFNTLLVRFLPTIEGGVLIVYVDGFLGVLIPLVVTAPHDRAKDVFTQLVSGGDWPTQGRASFIRITSSI